MAGITNSADPLTPKVDIRSAAFVAAFVAPFAARGPGRTSWADSAASRSSTGTPFDSDCAYERGFEGLKRYEPVSRGGPSQVAVCHVGRNDTAGFYYDVMESADDANADRGVRNAEP